MREHTKASRSCYQAGCRLPECIEENRRYAEERRRLAGKQPKKGWTHGLSGYIYGNDRCDVCRTAYRDYRREKRQAAG